MTYGSATVADNVKDYFQTIYGGKASAGLIADFENRYRLVGGSPLIRITREQATLLEKKLGETYVVRAGMRHSAPKIADAIAECRAAGAERLIGIVLSPQFSSIIMEGYRTAFAKAAKEHGYADDEIVVAGPWPTETHFIELLANRIEKSVAGVRMPIIFTTHSLPQNVVAKDPSYLDQLQSTIDAVRARLLEKSSKEDAASRGKLYADWYAGYQSAGHTPEAWLKPDLTDILDQIVVKKSSTPTAASAQAVLIVPIQFLADHLEILYDLDIAAKQQCEERGVAYQRIELPNTDPLFIEALAAIAKSFE